MRNTDWLDQARGCVSTKRESRMQERVIEYLAEHGSGCYTQTGIAERCGINFRIVARACAKLERSGLLVLERVRKEAGVGHFYGLSMPMPTVADLSTASPRQSVGSIEQAIPARVSDLSVEPNLQSVGSAPSSLTFASSHESLGRDSKGVRGLILEENKQTDVDARRARDVAQVEGRLGPIAAHGVATLSASLDEDRPGVIECVREVEQRMHSRTERVTNPVGVLLTKLRAHEHVGKRRACGHHGAPHPTVRHRPNSEHLCDCCWTKVEPLWRANRRHAAPVKETASVYPTPDEMRVENAERTRAASAEVAAIWRAAGVLGGIVSPDIEHREALT